MNEEQLDTNKLIDTTDCLEAIGVFRGWKNFLFVIIFLCLLLLQAAFWLVDTGCVEIEGRTGGRGFFMRAKGAGGNKEPAGQYTAAGIEQAAKQAAAEPNQPAAAVSPEPKSQGTGAGFGITFKQLVLPIRFLNFVLIPASVLYCLTMLFSLKVSMLGRLGGINHIARAFFLSLCFVVLLLPWQKLFGGVVAGVLYMPDELRVCCGTTEDSNIFCTVLYYLRFSVYWLVEVLLLVCAQLRSSRWARTVLRRLEVM